MHSVHSRLKICKVRLSDIYRVQATISHFNKSTIMGPIPKLFAPYTSPSGLQISHRIVLAPLTRLRSDENQVPLPMVRTHYVQRASTKGLLITEATAIHKEAAPYPGAPGIYSEAQIKVWKDVVDSVHKKGGKIFLQLWHVGRSVHSGLLNGNLPVSSSSVPQQGKVTAGAYAKATGFMADGEAPRALEIHEIKEIVQQYAQATENAVKKAGFDGVELHAANGYLPDQFLKDGVNQRTDEYGGSFENRTRFVMEILEAMTSRVGQEKSAVRFSPLGSFNDMKDSDPHGLFGYLFEQLSTKFPKLAYIHMTSLMGFGQSEEEIKKNEVKSLDLRKKWVGPMILNEWDIKREKAIELVESGVADMVAIGRQFIANPDLPLRLKKDLELNEGNPTTFYGGGAEGYIDYPFHEDNQAEVVAA